MNLNFCQIPTLSMKCPGMSEKLTYNLVATLAPSLLIGSSSFLQVIRKTINDFLPDWTIDNTIACL